MTFSLATLSSYTYMPANAEDLSDSMEWGMLSIGGGGFVSRIVTGKNVMYARTDAGGAYKYNFDTQKWELMSFITEQDKGYLSVDAMCVDPTDDDTVYMLCGCGYFSDARTAVFKTTDGGKNIQKTDVYYCKSIGYGAPEHEGDVNTLYMWGMPSENDKEGIYRSQDGGKTWDELNTDKHFGGTGNGNFIVGDMSKFGTVYMSTVGMGIVYGQFTGSSAEYETGDINGDGIINAADVLLLKKYILGEKLSASQSKRADMNNNGSVDVTDEVILINKILK